MKVDKENEIRLISKDIFFVFISENNRHFHNLEITLIEFNR